MGCAWRARHTCVNTLASTSHNNSRSQRMVSSYSRRDESAAPPLATSSYKDEMFVCSSSIGRTRPRGKGWRPLSLCHVHLTDHRFLLHGNKQAPIDIVTLVHGQMTGLLGCVVLQDGLSWNGCGHGWLLTSWLANLGVGTTMVLGLWC